MPTPRHALPAGALTHWQVSDLHECKRDQMADIRPPSADITQYVVRIRFVIFPGPRQFARLVRQFQWRAHRVGMELEDARRLTGPFDADLRQLRVRSYSVASWNR